MKHPHIHTYIYNVLFHNTWGKIDVDIYTKLPVAWESCGYRFMGFFLRLMRQSCVPLCVYVIRDPRAFTRAAIALEEEGGRGGGHEVREGCCSTLLCRGIECTYVLPLLPEISILLAFQIL